MPTVSNQLAQAQTNSERLVVRARSFLVIAIALLCALGLAFTAKQSSSGPSQATIDQVAAELDAQLREVAAGASSRAQTLADLPRLALAVATDAATVRDLTGEELAFRPKPNETIEIGQIPRNGPAVSLLRIPENSIVSVPLADEGIHLVKSGEDLRVASVVKVQPTARVGELLGAVAVTWLFDLTMVDKLLGPIGGGVTLKTPDGDVSIGRKMAADEPTISLALGNSVVPGVELTVPRPATTGWRMWQLGLAGGVAGVGILAGLFLKTAPTASVTPTISAMPVVSQLRKRDSAAPPDGFRIGKYIALSRLGSGGMADVYLARLEGEAGFERLVALKVMHDEMVSNPKFVEHFLDEARLAPRLNHPNIVAVTDLGKAGEKYVIAMEYVDGTDLERLIQNAAERKTSIPARVALAITRHICDGLHFAHSAVDAHGEPLHLVHRDVKSANVFVSRNGEVKVGDFGIAKIGSSVRSAKTEIGEVKGTAAYMAPEHRMGQEIDQRADVYAVGAICYELLTGEEINLDLAMIAHLGRTGWPHLTPPSIKRPELPVELDAIIFRAMAFDRESRFPSCEALELALAEVVERHSLAASDKLIAQCINDALTKLPQNAVPMERTAGNS